MMPDFEMPTAGRDISVRPHLIGNGRLKLVPFVDRPDFGPGNALGGVLEAGGCRTPDKALQQPQHAPAAEMAA